VFTAQAVAIPCAPGWRIRWLGVLLSQIFRNAPVPTAAQQSNALRLFHRS